MGLYTDLASGSELGPKPRAGLDRSSAQQLLAKAYEIDPVVTGAYAAANEVAVILQQTDAGATDTFTLTITLYGALKGKSFTTAAIAYNAVASAIETAIDVAATSAAVTGWTNGDIDVTMAGAAGIDDGTVTLTFAGTGVAGTPAVVALTPTGFTATGTISRSTVGRTDRKALKALYDLNVVAGTVHDSPNAPSDWTRPASNGQTRPRYDLIRALAILATQEDGTDLIYDAVAALYPGI